MHNSYYTINNRKLVKAMTQKGIRTGELSELTGLTDVTIAGLRSGRRSKCLKTTTFRIADALDIAIEEIVE